MAKSSSSFVCQSCGSVTQKWAGKCDACGEWNSIVEEKAAEITPKGLSVGKGKKIEWEAMDAQAEEPPRILTGISEFDRVLGGGLVPGSATLIGGDPGIGKSTILLQAVAKLAAGGASVAYISGEESIAQVRLRAKRLGLNATPTLPSPSGGGNIKSPPSLVEGGETRRSAAKADERVGVLLAAATSVRDIISSIESARPDVVVIDSIQTMFLDNLDAAPGTVSQVRACAHELIRVAKRRHMAMFLVGHVTKDGQIAGPRVLEHMVDTVLYFEGDRGHPFRILRGGSNT